MTRPGPATPGHSTGRRARKGGGSLRRLGPSRWELAVSAGRYDDGTPRRVFRTVRADNDREAVAQLTAFVAETQQSQHVATRELRDLIMDDAVRRFLDEHLAQEKGREAKTIADYWAPCQVVLAHHRLPPGPPGGRGHHRQAVRGHAGRRAVLLPAQPGQEPLRPVLPLGQARGIIAKSPMAEFELPTSTHVARPRVPPEVDELCLLLATAVEVVPELALGAVTGMRRGELVGIRRSRADPERGTITVDSAVSETGRVKGTKTRTERTSSVDAETMAMLGRHGQEMQERASLVGAVMSPDPFLFSLRLDCSAPMPPDYVTRTVAILKGHLGIEDKRPATIALEDEALCLFRQAPEPSTPGRPGVRRLHPGPAQVHLQRAARCRVQRLHGVPVPGTRPWRSHQALRQEPPLG